MYKLIKRYFIIYFTIMFVSNIYEILLDGLEDYLNGDGGYSFMFVFITGAIFSLIFSIFIMIGILLAKINNIFIYFYTSFITITNYYIVSYFVNDIGFLNLIIIFILGSYIIAFSLFYIKESFLTNKKLNETDHINLEAIKD